MGENSTCNKEIGGSYIQVLNLESKTPVTFPSTNELMKTTYMFSKTEANNALFKLKNRTKRKRLKLVIQIIRVLNIFVATISIRTSIRDSYLIFFHTE